MAGLKLLAFVARYVLVYAGSVTLLDRAEGGIEVGSTNFAPPFLGLVPSSATFVTALKRRIPT